MNGVFSIPLAGRPLTASSRASGKRARPLALRGFFAGPENPLVEIGVHAALDSHQQHRRFNPLVFYGPPSTGKSHLALGIASQWRSRDPQAHVVCRAAADFVWELAAAQENRGLSQMQREYRSSDLLVIEDLDHIAGKTSAQHELARTIEAVLQRDGQVILTATRLPRAIPGLTTMLRSRCSAGLAVPLTIPSPATRRQILVHLAALRGLDLSSEVIDLFVLHVAGTVRDMLGALIAIEASSDSLSLSVDSVQQYLESRASCEPDLRTITTKTARHFELKSADLRSPSRRQAITAARSVAVFLARDLTDLSLKRLGQFFGNRDHTTMLHACRRAEQQISSNPEIRDAVESLRQQLIASM